LNQLAVSAVLEEDLGAPRRDRQERLGLLQRVRSPVLVGNLRYLGTAPSSLLPGGWVAARTGMNETAGLDCLQEGGIRPGSIIIRLYLQTTKPPAPKMPEPQRS
jgi:hypothetical protein